MCPSFSHDVPFENGYNFSDRLLDITVRDTVFAGSQVVDRRVLAGCVSPLVVDRAESREPRAGRKDTELGLTSILRRSRGHERRCDVGVGARMRERTCREHRDEDARLSTRCDASGDARRGMGSMR